MASQTPRVAIADSVRELIDLAFATRYHDLEATLKAASQAVVLAEENRHVLSSDLNVAAWTEYGNALRIAGRYADAEKALLQAESLPLSDVRTRIHLLEVRASLERQQFRFQCAESYLATALAEQQALRDPDGEARLRNLLGIIYTDWGKLPRAILSFQDAMALFSPTTPLDVAVSTGHNLFEALIAANRLEDASATLLMLEPYYRQLNSPRITAKSEWMRARLCRALDQIPAARLAYESAYKLLSTEPRSPELVELAAEMADLVPIS